MRSKREYILVNGSKGRRRVFSDKDKFDEILKRRKARENRLAVRQNEKQRSRRNESSDNQPNVSRSGSVSPDGRWRAFIKNHNLFVHDLKDGADIQLSKDGAEIDRYIQPFFGHRIRSMLA